MYPGLASHAQPFVLCTRAILRYLGVEWVRCDVSLKPEMEGVENH